MSNLERSVVEEVLGPAPGGPPGPVREVLDGREVVLGGTRGLPVVRTLPNAVRRMVGAWCFVDHFAAADAHLVVPPHPHTGLQTVTWLVEGRVRHRDSLGSDQLIEPGQLNLMTAGYGIAHSEDSPADDHGALHGVQLWVALPEAARGGRPGFAHHADLPRVRVGGARVTVLLGSVGGATSPAQTYTPIMGAEVVLDGPAELPLNPAFEHAAMTLTGPLDSVRRAAQRPGGRVLGEWPRVDGGELAPGALLYLGEGRSSLALEGAGDRLLVLGGEPFAEEIVMWWNFIGRSHAEIVQMREEWMAGSSRFPPVGTRTPLPAPELPTTRLRPRGRLR